MPEGLNLLRIVLLKQDEEGNITGGEVLHPPLYAGKVLSRKEAQAAYTNESADGFDIHLKDNWFHITPLFGDVHVNDIPAFRNDRVNVGNLVQTLLPALDKAPEMGERTAIIYERPVPMRS